MPFYPDLVPAGWFDESADPSGWFDELSLSASSGPPPAPRGGLWRAWDEFEIRCAASFTQTVPAGVLAASAQGRVATFHTQATNAQSVGVDIILTAETDVSGNLSGDAYINIPLAGYTDTVSYTGSWPSSAAVVFDDLRIHVTVAGFWRTSWSGIRVYVNGSLHASVGAGSSTSLLKVMLSAIPVIGVLPVIFATAAVTPDPSLGPPPYVPTPGTTTGESYATITGGYRYKFIGGGWQSDPVTLSLNTPPSPSGCTSCTLPSPPTVGGTDSYAMTAGAFEYYTTSGGNPTTNQVDIGTSFVYAWPNYQSQITKLEANPGDYSVLLYRAGMPRATREATASCYAVPLVDDPVISTNNDTPFPRQSALLEIVGAGTGAIEDTLGYQFLAAGSYTVSRQSGSTPASGSGTACYRVATSSFPGAVDDYLDNADMPAFYHHDDGLFRYYNAWGHPLAHFGPWFPPEESGALKAYEWPVNGARANPTDYWHLLGDQWKNHPDLASDGDQKRTTLATWTGLEGGMNGVINSALGYGIRGWWGVHNFYADRVQPTDSYDLTSASSGSFTLTSATASYGVTITLTPSATTIAVDLDLGQFDREPFFYGYLAKRFEWEVLATNVSAARMLLVGQDGTTVQIASAASGILSGSRTRSTSTEYAGDWGLDFGGNIGPFVGTDALPLGESATMAGDVEMLHNPGYLTSWGAVKLRLEIDVVSTLSTAQIRYPVLILAEEDPTVLQLARQHAAVLYPSAPGVRYGNWSFWDYGTNTFQDPPIVQNPGGACSALDWLCWSRTALLGIAADDGLDAQIALVRDTYEGQTREDIATETHSVIWPDGPALVGFLINGYAEIPPGAPFPGQARDADWQRTFTPEVRVYDLAVEPRRYTVGGALPTVLKVGGTAWTSPSAVTVPGWSISEHTHTVDNTETGEIWLGSTNFADVYPWHGYFWAPASLETGSGISADVAADRRHAVARIDTTVRVLTQDPLLQDLYEIDTGITADSLCIRFDRNSRPVTLWLWTEESGSIVRRVSTDGGASFGSSATLATAMKPAAAVGPDRTQYVYYLTGSGPYDLKGRRYDSQGGALGAEFTVQTGVDNVQPAATAQPASGASHQIVLRYVVGGALVTKTSVDGVTFV